MGLESQTLRLVALPLAVLLAIAGPPSARAGSSGFLSELRLAILDHNLEPGGSESGLDLGAEILLAPLARPAGAGAFDILLSPRPHLGANLSLEGETSRLYLGLTWQVPLGTAYFLEASFGGAWHDGPLDEPGIASYGCELSFRESAALGVRISERLNLVAGVEHMSNADLCGRNRGLTSGGVRLGYAFD